MSRHGITRLVLIAISIATSRICATAAEPQPASLVSPRLSIPVETSHQRVTRLPDNIASMTRGPDDRIWWTLTAPPRDRGSPMTVNQISQAFISEDERATFKREFTQAAPNLIGWRPILFEPGGRIWFAGGLGRPLVGYDGATFVETKPGEIAPATQPSELTYGATGYIDHTAFFLLDSMGLTFDGATWNKFPIPHDVFSSNPSRLIPEIDAKGMMVVGSDGSVARWRAGQWTPFLASWIKLTSAMPTIAAAVTADGIWILTANRLNFSPYAGEGPIQTPAALATTLIEQLKADDFETREHATTALLALGYPATATVEKALAANPANELRFRLEFILNRLPVRPADLPKNATPDANPVRPLAPSIETIGKYHIEYPIFLLQNPDGSVLIGAGHISTGPTTAPASRPKQGLPPTAGILRIDRDGTVTQAAGADVLAQLTDHLGATNLREYLFFNRAGKTAWFAQSAHKPLLLDTTTIQVKRRLDEEIPNNCMLVTNDDVIITRSPTSTVAYNFSAPENRMLLKVSATVPGGAAHMQTGDGVLWTYTRTEDRTLQVIRFDGATIENRNLPPDSPLADISLGGLHSVLMSTQRIPIQAAAPVLWSLVSPAGATPPELLPDLIAHHTAEIAKEFQNIAASTPISGASVIADKKGQVWLSNPHTNLSVYADQKWLPMPTDFLVSTPQQRIFKILPAPDHSGVIISVSGTNTLQLATCDNGHVSFKAIPLDGSVSGAALPSDKGLWFNLRDNKSATDTAALLTDAGFIDKITNATAQFVDAQNNLWVTRTTDQTDQTWAVVRNGQMAPIVNIPSGQPRFFARKNGNVLVLRDDGIQEFIPETLNTNHFKLGPLYLLEYRPSAALSLSFSPQLDLFYAPSTAGGKVTLSVMPMPK